MNAGTVTFSKHKARLAVALMLALGLAGSGIAPIAASAESAQPSAPSTASVEASASAIATASAAVTIVIAPPAPKDPPAPAPRPRKHPSIRQQIINAGRAAGLSKTEIAALLWICERESAFHPSSHSSSECHGLFQLSAGMAHGHPWKNPTWNTKRAIRYMRGRYGGVMQAKAFWLSHHWY